MNILFSVPWIHTNNSGMVEGLSQEGHQVSFITMTVPQKNFMPDGIEDRIHYYLTDNKFFIPKKRRKQLHFENFSSINRVLKQEKPDLVIVREMKLLSIQIAWMASLKNIPVLFYDQSPPSSQKTYSHFIWDTLPQLLISRYRITTVKKKSSGISSDNKSSFFVPFAVPETEFKTEYKREITNDKPLNIIVVAKLDEKRKNIPFLIESLLPFFKKKLIRLSLYGELRGEKQHHHNFCKITNLIETHDLKSHVDINTNVQYKIVKQAYKENDLFILPSLKEPAAFSPFEAMSAGLPVIVTEQNGTNYIIKHGKNGFIFDPTSKHNLQNFIEFFIEKPDSLEAFGRHALNTINSKYRPVHFSKKLLTIFDALFR